MYHNSNKNLEISSHKEDLRVESRKVLSITERILNRAKVSGLGHRFPPPPPTSPVSPSSYLSLPRLNRLGHRHRSYLTVLKSFQTYLNSNLNFSRREIRRVLREEVVVEFSVFLFCFIF